MIPTYGDKKLIRRVTLKEPAVSVEDHVDGVEAAVRDLHLTRILELVA